MVVGMVLAGTLWVQAGAPGDTVAQVTLSAGSNTVMEDGKPHGCAIWTMLHAGQKVTVGANSKMMVFFLSPQRTEVITGPATFTAAPDGTHLGPDHMTVRSTKSAVVKTAGPQLQLIGNQYAADVLRLPTDPNSILDTFIPTATVSTTPQFAWSPMAGVTRYRFELLEDSGDQKPIVQLTTAEPHVKLPSPLKPGRYVWSVDAEGINANGHIDVLKAADAAGLRQARDAARDAAARDPQDATKWLQLASLEEQTDRPEAALKALQDGLSHNKDNPLLHWYLAQIYGQLNRPTDRSREMAWLKANPPR